MKISVVVCSRSGIPERLKEAIKRQTVQPDEVIEIVGDSLTAQRNEGVERSKGDLITFFDDDLILDYQYLEKVLEAFYRYPDAMAVTGKIVVEAFKPNILHTIFAHIFNLSRRGQGRFLISGFPETYDKEIVSITKSEVLHGCNMTIKREVFDDMEFDEDLEGGMFGEDDYFSYKLSRKSAIYYTPFAICYDDRDYPQGKQAWSTRCRIINLISRFKQRKCGLVESIIFWWSMVGFLTLKIIESVIMRDFSIIKGIYEGIRCWLRKRNNGTK
jgi:GT2 family glycosyltransferase